MKDKFKDIQTIVTNFWKLALALSMVGLAAYNLYQVREQLTAIGVQVVIGIAAGVVIVEGIVLLVKFLAATKEK